MPKLILEIRCDPGKGYPTLWREVFPDQASEEPLLWLMTRLDAAVDHAVMEGPLAISSLIITIKFGGLIARNVLRSNWRSAVETMFVTGGVYDDELEAESKNPFRGYNEANALQAKPDRPLELKDVLEIVPEEGGTNGQA